MKKKPGILQRILWKKKKIIRKIRPMRSIKTKPCPACGGKGQLENIISDGGRLRIQLEICQR